MSDAHREHPREPTRGERWRGRLRRFVRNPATTAKSIRQWTSRPSRLLRRYKRTAFAVRFARDRAALAREHGNPRRAKWWRKRAAEWAKVKARLDDALDRERGAFKIVPREAWDRSPGDRATAPMSSDSGGLFVHHSVAGSPTTLEGGKAEMRNLEAIARSRGFADFSYSFAVDELGNVYEGRGRMIEGAHTIGFNDTAHAVVAMGNFDNREPTRAMLHAIDELAEYLGARMIRGHRDVNPTGCPGARLYAAI